MKHPGKYLKNVLSIVWLMTLALSVQAQSYQVSPTKYDYSELAQSITQNAYTKLDKAKAIFDWITTHIAYDVSYSIYTADQCIEQGKGVCQAYSELFYRLCEPIGVPCTIIIGHNKDMWGNINQTGHGWVYVETEKGGILIDPTWGAGSIVNNRFVPDKRDFWFDVDPYWMIFTHIPRDSQWQLIDKPIDMATFVSLPVLKPHCQYLGWNAKEIFTKLRDNKIKGLPKVMDFNIQKAVRLKSMPMQSTLNPATKYRFEVENPNNQEFAITVNGSTWYHRDIWTKTNTGYYIDVMPGAGGSLAVAVKLPNNTYEYLLEYKVNYPTEAEREYIAKNSPPVITPLNMPTVTLVDIPMTGTLNPAKKYRFVVKNPHNLDFALFVNHTAYKASQWKQSGDKWEIEVMPEDGGYVKLGIANGMGAYATMVEYKVSYPTQKEKEYIQTHRPPTIYPLDFESIQLLEYPPYKILSSTKSYHFEVDNPHDINFALVINGTWHYKSEWKQTGTKYAIDIVPGKVGPMYLFVKNNYPGNSFSLMMEYEVKAH